MSTPLTTHLLSLTPSTLTRATTHPFLTSSGNGTLPKATLSQWLAQDRLYAQSYIRFIGLLLSKIRIESHNPDSLNPRTPTIEQNTASVLIDALVNIRTELGLFESTAEEGGLDLSALPEAFGENSAGREQGVTVFGPNRITQAYIDMFMSAGSAGTSFLEGMVVLWATEVCYLRAWRYAASLMGESTKERGQDADGGVLREKFIPNWSSEEFEAFVKSIGVCVDDLAGQVKGAEETEKLRARCAQWWRQVLWLEERFWPNV